MNAHECDTNARLHTGSSCIRLHSTMVCIQRVTHTGVQRIRPHSGRKMQHGCTCMQHAPYAAHRMQRAPYATRCIHPNFNAFRSETHTPAFTQKNATWMHMYADHRMQLYASPTCMQLYEVRPSVCGDMQHIVCGRMQSYAVCSLEMHTQMHVYACMFHSYAFLKSRMHAIP